MAMPGFRIRPSFRFFCTGLSNACPLLRRIFCSFPWVGCSRKRLLGPSRSICSIIVWRFFPSGIGGFKRWRTSPDCLELCTVIAERGGLGPPLRETPSRYASIAGLPISQRAVGGRIFCSADIPQRICKGGLMGGGARSPWHGQPPPRFFFRQGVF